MPGRKGIENLKATMDVGDEKFYIYGDVFITEGTI